jgi:hypothetical protein
LAALANRALANPLPAPVLSDPPPPRKKLKVRPRHQWTKNRTKHAYTKKT